MVNDDLALERMLLLFARIVTRRHNYVEELLLAFNRGFSDIHHHHIMLAKASYEKHKARDAKLTSAINRSSTRWTIRHTVDSEIAQLVAVAAVLLPIFEGDLNSDQDAKGGTPKAVACALLRNTSYQSCSGQPGESGRRLVRGCTHPPSQSTVCTDDLARREAPTGNCRPAGSPLRQLSVHTFDHALEGGSSDTESTLKLTLTESLAGIYVRLPVRETVN